MIVLKKIPIPATSLRVWRKTRDKLKALAKHYQIPMTQLLDQVCDNLIKANNIPFGKREEPQDGETR